MGIACLSLVFSLYSSAREFLSVKFTQSKVHQRWSGISVNNTEMNATPIKIPLEPFRVLRCLHMLCMLACTLHVHKRLTMEENNKLSMCHRCADSREIRASLSPFFFNFISEAGEHLGMSSEKESVPALSSRMNFATEKNNNTKTVTLCKYHSIVSSTLCS